MAFSTSRLSASRRVVPADKVRVSASYSRMISSRSVPYRCRVAIVRYLSLLVMTIRASTAPNNAVDPSGASPISAFSLLGALVRYEDVCSCLTCQGVEWFKAVADLHVVITVTDSDETKNRIHDHKYRFP